MTLTEFVHSVAEETAPSVTLSNPLQALWYERKGDWERAHRIAQDSPGSEGPGSMPISIVRNTIWGMPATGIAEPAVQNPGGPGNRNGNPS